MQIGRLKLFFSACIYVYSSVRFSWVRKGMLACFTVSQIHKKLLTAWLLFRHCSDRAVATCLSQNNWTYIKNEPQNVCLLWQEQLLKVQVLPARLELMVFYLKRNLSLVCAFYGRFHLILAYSRCKLYHQSIIRFPDLFCRLLQSTSEGEKTSSMNWKLFLQMWLVAYLYSVYNQLTVPFG